MRDSRFKAFLAAGLVFTTLAGCQLTPADARRSEWMQWYQRGFDDQRRAGFEVQADMVIGGPNAAEWERAYRSGAASARRKMEAKQ